jgi:glyoxylase I family protein
MQVQSLDHITLTVSDLERSRKFYSEILGFTTTDVNYDAGNIVLGFCFVVGGVSIWFLKHEAMPARDIFSETRTGLDHLSFRATNDVELKAPADKLLAAGVNTKGMETFVSGNKYIALRDPDNIQLEFWLPD